MTVNLSQTRMEQLRKDEDILRRDLDRHLDLGGKIIDKNISGVKQNVLAKVYGIVPSSAAEDVRENALRWLLANTYHSKTSYRPELGTPQWSTIMEYYFRRAHGLYAEVALTERIALSIARKQVRADLLGDIFLADRFADYHMMSDCMLHLNLPQGKLQLGIQLGTGRGVGRKLNDLHIRPLNDASIVRDGHTLDAFLRDNTAVLMFPRFNTGEKGRAQSLRRLLGGSVRYQSEMITMGGNRSFHTYGEKVERVLQFFHDGVMDGTIYPRARLNHHEFAETDERGETVSGAIFDHRGIPIVTIKHQDPPVRTSPQGVRPKYTRSTNVIYSVPIFPDFIELYTDLSRKPKNN